MKELINESDPTYVGIVLPYMQASANIPANWQLCDGSEVSELYADFIRLVGDSTPKMNGRTLVGSGTLGDDDYVLNETDGATEHLLTLEEMPSHQHYGWGAAGKKNNWGFYKKEDGKTKNTGYTDKDSFDGTKGGNQSNNHLYGSTYAGGVYGEEQTLGVSKQPLTTGIEPVENTAHNNMQPYRVVNYIIYLGLPVAAEENNSKN